MVEANLVHAQAVELLYSTTLEIDPASSSMPTPGQYQSWWLEGICVQDSTQLSLADIDPSVIGTASHQGRRVS